MQNRSSRTQAMLVCALVLAGCASAPSIVEPEFQVRMLHVPEGLPDSSEGFATMVEIAATNRSNETMTLERIQVTSVGEGRYTIQPASENFQRDLRPGEVATFPVRVSVLRWETLGRADNEPLNVRAMITFSINDHSYRRTILQRILPGSIQPWG